MASLFQWLSGAPEMYHAEPLSARIMPSRFSAWATTRAWYGRPAMLTPRLRRTRSPIGGSEEPLHVDASWRAGYTYFFAVHGAEKRSAWSIAPWATSLYS